MTSGTELKSSINGVWSRSCCEYRFKIDLVRIPGGLKPWFWGSRLHEKRFFHESLLPIIYHKMIPESSHKWPKCSQNASKTLSEKFLKNMLENIQKWSPNESQKGAPGLENTRPGRSGTPLWGNMSANTVKRLSQTPPLDDFEVIIGLIFHVFWRQNLRQGM